MATRMVGRKLNANKWSIDFISRPKFLNEKHLQTAGQEIIQPLGYTDNRQLTSSDSHVVDNTLVAKKSWDIALGPMKQVPMTLFIMYMAGNTISIFPIMMVGMMLLRPVKSLLAVHSTFVMLEGDQAFAQKIVYFIGNLALVGLAVYKCQSMGLLPTSPSDWLEFMDLKTILEHSGGGISL